MFTDMQMYGQRHESSILPGAKCQISMQSLFICNDIDKNLNKKFYTSRRIGRRKSRKTYMLHIKTRCFFGANLGF